MPKTRLPGQLEPAVEFFGRLYPAWLEPRSRRVWTLAGAAGFGARLVLSYDRFAYDAKHAAKLRRRLEKAGYKSITLKPRPRLKIKPPRPAPSNASPAPGSPPANSPPDTSPRRSPPPRR